MLKKLRIDWSQVQFIGFLVFGMFFLNYEVYPQKRIVPVSRGSVVIQRAKEFPPASNNAGVLPKTSVANNLVTVALNDGVAEGNVNPQEFDLDQNGNTDPNTAADQLFVIFEPADFAAYGVSFPMRITGVHFFNNDHQTVWPEVLVYSVTGDRANFSVDIDTPLLQANNVTGPAWGMAPADFASPYTVNQSTSLAILIRFPVGGQYTDVGAGGGPAIGLDFDGLDDPSFPPAGMTARNGNSFVSVDGENAYRIVDSGDGLPVNLMMNLIVETVGDCYQPPYDPVAWWPGDGNPDDIIGGKHGIVRNVETGGGYADGKVDQAFLFDGVNDYVFTPLDVQPSAIPETTWEAWVYPQRANYSYRQTLFSNDNGGYDRTVLVEANTSNFGVFTGTSVWQPTSINLNQWQHIAVVYSTDNILFYKNGQQFSYGVAPVDQSSIWSLYIGRNPGYGEYFKGIIDEVSIYDRVLDAGEIMAIYNAGSNGKCKAGTTPGEASISGRLVDYDGQDPIADARVNLTGDVTNEKTTDDQGQYAFTELSTGVSYNVTPNHSGMFFQPAFRQYDPLTGDQINQDFTGSLYGDVSGNDEVKSFDASMVLRFVVGQIDWQDPSRDNVAADVSGDGTIKSFDASLILRYIVGAITSFPVEDSSTGKSVFSDGRSHIGTIVHMEGGLLVAGTRATISVSIENEDEVFSSDLTFLFNPSVLKLVMISPGKIADGFLVAHSVRNNEIRIGLAGAHPIQSSGRLLNLELDVLPPTEGSDDASPLILKEAVFNEGLQPEKVINATFDLPMLPTHLMLGQNYPNPFNPNTTIDFELPVSGVILLKIYDIRGREVATLVNEEKPAGRYRISFDASHLPGGIYFSKIQFRNHVQMRKMIFIK